CPWSFIKINSVCPPEVAARKHAQIIMPLLLEVGIDPQGSGIDVVAVTAGPGLVPALRIGVELGKALAYMWHKPLVAVNHLEGHLYSNWLEQNKPAFPCLALLVSGGHTELILMKDHGQYELIGMTRDDAAGEAFDKVAKLLGLGYPGGPEISKQAEQGNPEAIAFPRPMLESGDYDFSFSGLKTAVAVYLKANPKHDIADVCASFQAAVIETLVIKTMKAVDKYQPQSVILSGGVSANKKLRDDLGTAVLSRSGITYHAPDLFLTGDNATMIAVAGYYRALAKDFVDPLVLSADPNLRLA
ncbi:tRNA (adenosine(37)-N6)-threonylcarbamoyltransferase complex transferase subunit TsaD, partial [Patescibacteria group bacterium]